MYNCIYAPHCMEDVCDASCPKWVETSYLLERNGIAITNPVFHAPQSKIDAVNSKLDLLSGKLGVVVSSDTVQAADLYTYCAICRNWQGSRLHCTVYNLKYSKFLDDTKKSWSSRFEPESLEYTRIFTDTSKVLVISNLDYVNFKDFESQTLLNIIQQRRSDQKTTIVVCPNPGPNKLIGDNAFFIRLKELLQAAPRVEVSFK